MTAALQARSLMAGPAQSKGESGIREIQGAQGDAGPASAGDPATAVTPASPYPSSVVNVEPLPDVNIAFLGASGGITTVTTGKSARVPPPAAVQLGANPEYYRISTTSDFFSAMVCVPYDPDLAAASESSLSLLHKDGRSGWEPVTLAMPNNPNPATHTICGRVANLSTFVVGVVPTEVLFRDLLDDIRTLPSSTTTRGMRHRLHSDVRAAHEALGRGENDAAREHLSGMIDDMREEVGVQLNAVDANRLFNKAAILQDRLARNAHVDPAILPR